MSQRDLEVKFRDLWNEKERHGGFASAAKAIDLQERYRTLLQCSQESAPTSRGGRAGIQESFGRSDRESAESVFFDAPVGELGDRVFQGPSSENWATLPPRSSGRNERTP